jgi:hypothetical protein
MWTTLVETNALHFSYLHLIARERDWEAPITHRKSIDSFLKGKQPMALPLFPLGLEESQNQHI